MFEDILLAVGCLTLLYLIVSEAQSGGVDSLGAADPYAGSYDNSSASGDNSGMASTSSTSNNSDLLTKWAQAIFHFEGGNPGDRNVRNNNPGNLKYSGQTGAIGADSGGFAIFSSSDAGWAALEADLSAKVNKYPNYSLLQIMTRYLGGNPSDPQITSQGNPFQYAASVAKNLGVSVSDTLASIFG